MLSPPLKGGSEAFRRAGDLSLHLDLSEVQDGQGSG